MNSPNKGKFMAQKDSIGDRMKLYESAYNHTYPIRLPLMLRFDGVHFHSNVKRWKCKKPFDDDLIDAMQFTARTLCESIAGAQLAYVQSDEITLLIRDDMTNQTQPWYNKEVNKILSVGASKATNAFNFRYQQLKGQFNSLLDMAEFDCRGWVVPENEIFSEFLWREQDCTRNSVQMIGRNYFTHKELQGKSNEQIQEMLFTQHGINWNDTPTHYKRGACVVKVDAPIIVPKRDKSGKFIGDEVETIIRPKWIIDKNIPIFTQDKEYINRFARLAN